MATKPTPGASDGTYGTELNAHLDVSLDVNGKIKTEALQTDSTAPVADAAVANRKYVDDVAKTGEDAMHDAQGGYNNVDVNGTKTKVYTKYFTGTTDADSATNVAHGVTGGLTKILHVSASIFETGNSWFATYDFRDSGVSARFILVWNGTNVILTSVGSTLQSQSYVIKVDYIL